VPQPTALPFDLLHIREKSLFCFVQSNYALSCAQVLHIASVLLPIAAGLNLKLIYVRSILILLSLLGIFTSSVSFASVIPGNVYVFISYLSRVLQLRPIS
jgi:hypothetical protein